MYVEIVHPRAEYPSTDWMATAVNPPGAFDPTTVVAVMTAVLDVGRRHINIYDFGTMPSTDWIATTVSPPGVFDPTTAVAAMTIAYDAGRRRGSVYDFGAAPMTIIGSPQSVYRPVLRPRRR